VLYKPYAWEEPEEESGKKEQQKRREKNCKKIRFSPQRPVKAVQAAS
jgi:hypothetical protein